MAPKTLNITFAGDSSSLSRTFKDIGGDASKLGAGLVNLGKTAAVGLAVGVAAVGGFAVKMGVDAVNAYAEAEQVGAQTNAVLKSTGQIANVTADDVDDLATAISRKTGIDDEAVASAENMLLTFTNIRNEVGKGNDIFDQATEAVTDVATAMNGGAIPSAEDLTTASIQLGKALNDPIKGVAALGRVGIQFTEQQKEQIKTLVESGQTLEAQKIILAELEKQFGGSAAAAGDTFAGMLAKVKVSAGNLQEAIGQQLVEKALPAFVSGLTGGESKTLDLTSGLDKLTDRILNSGAAFENGARKAGEFIRSVKEAFSDPAGAVEGGRKFAADFIAGFKEGTASTGGSGEWLLSVTGDSSSAGQNIASTLGASMSAALPEAFRDLDYGSVIQSLSGGFLEALPNIPWDVIVLAMATTFLQTLTNLDWGALVLTGIKIFDEIVAGFIGGVVDAFMRDPGQFALLIIGLLFAPDKWIKPILGALERIPIVGTLFKWAGESVSQVGERLKGVIGERFRSSFSWGIDFSMDAVRQLPGKARAALGNLGNVLWDAGSSLMGGLLDGIASAWRRVASYLSGLASKIRNLKGPIEKDRKLLIPEGSAIMESLLTGLEKRRGDLDRLMGSITKQIDVSGAALPVGGMGLQPAFAGAGVGGGPVQPLIVQLTLDHRVISEVVIDDITRKGKANGSAFAGLG